MTELNGYQHVILEVSDEEFAFAEAMAEDQGYFGPADYLNGLLKRALLEDMEIAPVLSRCEDERIIGEDPGGGLHLLDDIDDDIPF